MNKMFFFILVLFQHAAIAFSQKPCPLLNLCSFNGECQNFTSFQDFAFDACLQYDAIAQLAVQQSFVGFKMLCTKNQLILNQSFDISSVLKFYKQILTINPQPFFINFYNIAGIDLSVIPDRNALNDLAQFYVPILFGIYFSPRLNLYWKNELISCQNLSANQTLANIFTPLVSELEFQFVKFDGGFCLEAFRNLNVDKLTITGSYFWSLKPKVNASDDLNIHISFLDISLSKVVKFVLDQTAISSEMFAHTGHISLANMAVHSVQPVDLFRNFTQLRYLRLHLNNMKSFFHHTHDAGWLTYLNYNVSAPQAFWSSITHLTTLERQYIQENIFAIFLQRIDQYDMEKVKSSFFPYYVYDFPSEDFCLFVNFPHRQLVYMSFFIDPTRLNFTCTMISLVQYIYTKYIPNNMTLEINRIWPEFNQHLNSCDLETRAKLCNITQNDDYHDTYFDIYDMKVGLDEASKILVTYLGPLFSSFGVLTNCLLIAVILHNKIKYKNKQTITLLNKSRSNQLVFLLDEPLYKYMLINGLLSEIYCIVYLFDLSIPCVPVSYYNGQIDTFKMFIEENCVIKDMVIGFMASVLKLMSNVMIIQMSINRYILLGKDQAKFLLNLAGLNIKKLSLVSFLLSCLLSIVNVFKERTFAAKTLSGGTADKLVDNNYNIFKDPEYYLLHNYQGAYLFGLYFSGLPTIMSFMLLYHQISDTIFCVFSLILDILTMKRLRQVLNEHAKIAKSDEEAKKKRAAEIKSFWMVFAFNSTNAVIRLPDMVSSAFLIVGFVHPSILHTLCGRFSSCLTLDKITNVFYIFSLSINLFLYRTFYSTFQDCFSDLVVTIKSKFQKEQVK